MTNAEDKMNNLVRIKTYKVQMRGIRSITVGLPKIWIEENELSTDDRIDFFKAPGSNDLIIRKAETP